MSIVRPKAPDISLSQQVRKNARAGGQGGGRVTPKRECGIAIDDIRIFVEKVCIGARHPFVIKQQLTCAQNLCTCKEHMDNLQIPCFAVKDLKDDSRGPGAGLMASNENLFSAQVSRSRHAPLTSSMTHCRRHRTKLERIIQILDEVTPLHPIRSLVPHLQPHRYRRPKCLTRFHR
jgi:hypothetical protein